MTKWLIGWGRLGTGRGGMCSLHHFHWCCLFSSISIYQEGTNGKKSCSIKFLKGRLASIIFNCEPQESSSHLYLSSWVIVFPPLHLSDPTGGTDALIHRTTRLRFTDGPPPLEQLLQPVLTAGQTSLNTRPRRARPDEGKSLMVLSNHWHPPLTAV